MQEDHLMANRKQFLEAAPADPELIAIIENSRKIKVTEDELREQRISFAYGNALESDEVTKDSVRKASKKIQLLD